MVRFSNGAASTRNYFLGRGVVQFSILDGNDCPGPFRDVGNSCSFNLNASTEVIEHFQCRNRVRSKDLELISEISYDISIELDEYSLENLGITTLSTANSYAVPGLATNDALSGVMGGLPAITPFQADESPLSGRYYDVYMPTPGDGGTINIGAGAAGECDFATRAYNLAQSGFTITISGNAYTAGPDTFTYDPSTGQIFVIYVANPAGGTFLADLNLAALTGVVPTVDYVAPADVSADRLPQLLGATTDQVSIAIRAYLSNQADDVAEEEWTFHKATIRPNGDLGLITNEDFGTLTLEGSLSSVPDTVDSAGNGFFTVRDLSSLS